MAVTTPKVMHVAYHGGTQLHADGLDQTVGDVQQKSTVALPRRRSITVVTQTVHTFSAAQVQPYHMIYKPVQSLVSSSICDRVGVA